MCVCVCVCVLLQIGTNLLFSRTQRFIVDRNQCTFFENSFFFNFSDPEKREGDADSGLYKAQAEDISPGQIIDNPETTLVGVPRTIAICEDGKNKAHRTN